MSGHSQAWTPQNCLFPCIRHGTGSLGHRVNGSFGHLSRPGHRVIILTRCETQLFRFSKKCPKCKTYICNAEMTTVIIRCLLFHWNHWISVHAMNFYFYLWLLKILWPENTSSHINRHLVFIIEQGHRVNWVSGSLDSRNSQIHKMWPSSISALHGYIGPASPLFIQHLDWVNRFCKATDR